jgi:hypothetical protein
MVYLALTNQKYSIVIASYLIYIMQETAFNQNITTSLCQGCAKIPGSKESKDNPPLCLIVSVVDLSNNNTKYPYSLVFN